jgi:GGDEF domain-containing protein
MKWSNDYFGFQVGDTMIRSVAETLHQIVGDRSLRWRGDEWLVMSDQEDGFALAQHITDTIAATTLPISCEESPADPSEKYPDYFGARMTTEGLRFTVSIGVSGHRNFDTALDQSKQALSLSKTNGRNRVVLG